MTRWLALLVFLAALFVSARLGPNALAAEEFALEINFDGSGSGTVQCKVGAEPAAPCQSAYPAGTELTLLPNPAAGSEFTEFSGDCGPEECELTMDGPKALIVTFDLEGVAEFALTITLKGTGSGVVECEVDAGPEPCAASYPEGTELSLAPEPDTGSEFVRWGGACSGEGECELTMEGPRTVTATFNLEPVPPKFTLTVNINGSGKGTVECEAQEGPEPCQAKYPEGTELALLPSPSPGSEFAGFGGACAGQTCEVEMAGPRTVSATFNLLPAGLKYTLAVERIGTGSGSVSSEPGGIDCGSDCVQAYPEGTAVVLAATPAEGSIFDHWSGGGCAGNGTCKVTMGGDRLVNAVFTATGQRTLTVAKGGTGAGTVTSSPAGIECGTACAAGFGLGIKVTLTAAPQAGSKFTGFSGACTGTGTCSVTMDEARSVTANFAKGAKLGKARVATSAKVRGRKALLRLTCKGIDSCAGTVRLSAALGSTAKRVTIGRAPFGLPRGASTTLRVKLSHKALRLLKAGQRLKSKVGGRGVRPGPVRLMSG